jgi:hypothetical protein
MPRMASTPSLKHLLLSYENEIHQQHLLQQAEKAFTLFSSPTSDYPLIN